MKTTFSEIRKQLFFLAVILAGSALQAQVVYTPESFKSINSVYDEQNPVISPDGQMMFLTIRNHPNNVDSRRDPGDIWISTWNGTSWSTPVHGGNLINDRAYNTVAGVSPDGSWILLLHHYDPSGQARTQGISISRKNGNGWSRPENIFITYFQNRSSIISGALSDDGNTLIYSAETYGTYGVDDLYVTFRQEDGRWSEPRNLGSTINTQFQEISPSLSADGSTLYFSTNGRRGYGSFDIYSSTRLDDTFIRWTEPENLGTEINTEGRDLYYRVYERLGVTLYTSTVNSDGYGDVKVKVRTHEVIPLPAAPVIVPPQPVVVPEPAPFIAPGTIRIYGKAIHARTGETISTSIRFTDPKGTERINSEAQGYTVTLQAGQLYTVDVEATGFVSKFDKLDLTDVEINQLELNFTLQPIEIGTTVNLNSVLFKQSSPELLPESYAELDLVVAFMKANPSVEIELAGHTDNRGSFRQLMELSQKRVNRVKDYLVSKGIDKKRIMGRGYGGSKPIASNDTEEQRMLNRRVEFIIRKN
ncbi:MAG: OmpA family protein [Cyclobacteriaceae bacterium]|nr:OmpA family protein [Cyclobacteriaceae bacterium]